MPVPFRDLGHYFPFICDTIAFEGFGVDGVGGGGWGVGGGVGWDNNVHVPVHTQARQAHHTRAARSSWFTIGGVGCGVGGGVEWDNNVHVPVHTRTHTGTASSSHKSCTFIMVHYWGGWGWQGKTRTMWRGPFFAKIYPTLRKKKSHTLLTDILYTALSPDQPPQSDLLHPPQQMVLALDMSYLLEFSHLTPTDQTVIFPMKFLRAFTHFTLTFIPIFLVHLFHSVTVLFFPFSYASEPTSQVELSSLYVSNFLLALHFLHFWVSNNFMFHPEGSLISLLRFFQLGRGREDWDLFDRYACA